MSSLGVGGLPSKPTILWPGPKSPDILVQTSDFFTMQDLDLLHHFVVAASPATLEDGGLIQISQEVPRMAFQVSLSKDRRGRFGSSWCCSTRTSCM